MEIARRRPASRAEIIASSALDGVWRAGDKTGKMVIPYQYASAGSFVNGAASVELGNDDETYIDTTGKDLLLQRKWLLMRIPLTGLDFL